MSRILLLGALAGVYLAAGLGGRIGELLSPNRFDPFLPIARSVELRIGERRFAEALPLANSLARTYPTEPLVAYWRGQIARGLGDAPAEAAAWEDFVRLSTAPADACPALAEAYARAGKAPEALRAYERCAQFAPDDPDRLADLGDGYARAGRRADAHAAFARALALDPENPALAARTSALESEGQ
jgi:tetratricopeptide (TPR) repeat protein